MQHYWRTNTWPKNVSQCGHEKKWKLPWYVRKFFILILLAVNFSLQYGHFISKHLDSKYLLVLLK